MNLYLFALVILAGLAVADLIVGVSNDAVNFLNSSIGSKVASRNVIMVIASLGMLAGVTFSSGMMEVARKGIFHPEFFLMPELIILFLAVMLTDILLLDLFNTFGLPTSTTVSIVFELLGAAVAVSLIKIISNDENLASLVNYINTGKALAIIMGILMSVVLAFFFGMVTMFASRLLFTFDYEKKLKRYGGLWCGFALSVITYFILIKGAKGTSFLTPEIVAWIKIHTWALFFSNFVIFAIIFQALATFTKLNILKPIVLVGTFALAMAFAANDLVNFIGVPLAGMSAYSVAHEAVNPLTASMGALGKAVQTNTYLLLFAGIIMVITLWVSKKSRTVSQTELNLGRQDEGIERFGSSTLSRTVVRMGYAWYRVINRMIPPSIRSAISGRMDPVNYTVAQESGDQRASFDLLRASVNFMVASAVVSFATSLKLPLSTTYVTFMVSMGTSLSDQAWGRESAVYRITGVLTVVGGWFFTALAAFSVSFLIAGLIMIFKLPGFIVVLVIAIILIISSHRLHFTRTTELSAIEAFSLKNIHSPRVAADTVFEQTGQFLKEISDTLGDCIEAAFLENRNRLKDARIETGKIEKWGNVIIANTFKTLFLLNEEDVADTQKYSRTIRAIQAITESHRDIISRLSEHFENYHTGFLDVQKEELRRLKTQITRLLWNSSIMMLSRKKVDYDYIANQKQKLIDLANEFDRNQIERIQNGESKTRLSILFYGIMENSQKIAEQTQNLLDIFKVYLQMKENDS